MNRSALGIRSLRNWKVVFGGVLACILLVVMFLGPRLLRLYRVNHLFDEDVIVQNFLHMEDVFPVTTIPASSEPFRFQQGETITLPEQLSFKGDTVDTQVHFDQTNVTGLLVIKDDQIVFEEYYRGHTEEGHHMSWSAVKSFVSALVGIALDEGAFDSIEDPITQYVPELTGSGYEGVRIKDILQMSSGVRFNEDYGDFSSDINRFGRILAWGGSLDEFAASLEAEVPPGTRHHYVSIDTQVLGMLLARVTHKSLSQYLEEKLWHPLGMEYPAYFIVDDDGMELALGGLNASLRDYAKLGYLYLNEGRWGEEQIVPRQWVLDSVTPDAAHLLPGEDNPLSNTSWGYGYQWWIPLDPDGEFMAVGIRNQFIYVYPKERLVIAKNTANHDYNSDREYYKGLDLDLFRAIAASLR
jgi:CubicO group peptidase (beta-lactamase class C family)